MIILCIFACKEKRNNGYKTQTRNDGKTREPDDLGNRRLLGLLPHGDIVGAHPTPTH